LKFVLTSIKAIIADDEKHARERLRELLDTFGLFHIIGEASTGQEALEMMVLHKPDVAFLDINMPGISIFETISSLNKPPLIVFQTAYSEYAAEAFNINALDYLMKPFSLERLNRTVQKIKETLSHHRAIPVKKESDQARIERISVRDRGAIQFIPIKDIQKILIEDGLCFIFAHEKRYVSDKSLKYFEEKLIDWGFFRTSRAHLVNLDCIKAIHPMFQGSYVIELKDKSRVDLSRRQAQVLRKKMQF
jgi:two-component system LytT family response regulator